MTTPLALLTEWVARQASPTGRAWFEDGMARVPSLDAKERAVLLTVAGRQVGRADLVLGTDDQAAADRARPNWRPAGLRMVDAARLALLLAGYDGNGAAFAATLLMLCRTADLKEAIGYYRGLPVFPEPKQMLPVAQEGLRSAIQSIFDAVAMESPFPAETFDESTWNQMVLKSIFIGSSLSTIQGLKDRTNQRLATTLVDYAHERWSADRPVTPELWQCVGRFAGAYEAAALHRATESHDPAERRAAITETMEIIGVWVAPML